MLSNGSLAHTGWAKFERKWRREGNLSKETRGIYNFNSQNIWEENDDDDGGDHDDGDGDDLERAKSDIKGDKVDFQFQSKRISRNCEIDSPDNLRDIVKEFQKTQIRLMLSLVTFVDKQSTKYATLMYSYKLQHISPIKFLFNMYDGIPQQKSGSFLQRNLHRFLHRNGARMTVGLWPTRVGVELFRIGNILSYLTIVKV